MVRDVLREKFLLGLMGEGKTSGNAQLRKVLGWKKDTYTAVRDALIEEGAIKPGV